MCVCVFGVNCSIKLGYEGRIFFITFFIIIFFLYEGHIEH